MIVNKLKDAERAKLNLGRRSNHYHGKHAGVLFRYVRSEQDDDIHQ